jgi:hypothetical protein
VLPGHISSDIFACLLYISCYIEGIARRFGNCKSVVESNACWNGTKA